MTSEQKIIAVAGPKGGCGKTTFSAGLARSLAELGHPVRIICLEQEQTFGRERDLRMIYRMSDPGRRDDDAAIVMAGTLQAVKTPSELISLSVSPLLDENELLGLARACSETYIIFDLPPRYRFAKLLDLVDFPVLVTTPEPNAMIMAVRWVRYMIRSRLDSHPDIAHRLESDSSWLYRDLQDTLSTEQSNIYNEAASQKNTFFVLNERREGGEITQAQAFCHACWAFLGFDIQLLGTLRFEERRWFFSRMFSNDDPLSQDDSMKPELLEIARRITTFAPEKRISGTTLNPIQNARDFLCPDPGEEPRHAYRRLYEGYRRENSIAEWAFTPALVRQAMTMLDAAWQHIHFEMNAHVAADDHIEQNHPSAPVQKSMNNNNEPLLQSGDRLPDVSRKLSGAFAKATILNELRDDNAGDWLRACRLNTGMTIPQLSCKTRISQRYISLIEQNSLDSFSAAHLKAYLFEIAKALSLPLPELLKKFGFQS